MLAVDTNVVVANSGGAGAVFCGMETICRCDSLEAVGCRAGFTGSAEEVSYFLTASRRVNWTLSS